MNRHDYLTKTPVPKLIMSLAVPTIISMLVTGIYNTADTFFVGKISTQATAAVGLVFSIMTIIQAVGFFFGQGLAATSTLLLNVMAGRYGGDAAIAGMSIVTRVMMLLASALIGFGGENRTFSPL